MRLIFISHFFKPWARGHVTHIASMRNLRTVPVVNDPIQAVTGDVRSRISQIEAMFKGLEATNVASPPAGQDFASAYAQGVSSAGLAPSGVDPLTFGRDLLSRVGAPVTEDNLTAVSAWIKAEGTSASFNPLATVRKAPGATDFNTTGVKNFVSYAQGVETTAQALTNGLYTNVLSALYKGDDPYAVADAIADSPWGSGGLVRSVLESRGVPRGG